VITAVTPLSLEPPKRAAAARPENRLVGEPANSDSIVSSTTTGADRVDGEGEPDRFLEIVLPVSSISGCADLDGRARSLLLISAGRSKLSEATSERARRCLLEAMNTLACRTGRAVDEEADGEEGFTGRLRRQTSVGRRSAASRRDLIEASIPVAI
jgi:hypothetical protein